MQLTAITKSLRLTSLGWHKRVVWFGALTLLLWGVSGISHPLMSWLGPKAERFYPPSFTLNTVEAEQVSRLINSALQTGRLDHARVVKLVAGARGPQLQITEAMDQARHYLPLKENADVDNLPARSAATNADAQQARWLASYYTGRENAEITQIEFKTQFSADYPWVNRLLPVYKIRFSGADQLTAYVHTETNALASLNNRTKQTLQSLFQALHTWSWLGHSELNRVLIISLLIASLFAMALSGMTMLFTFRSRQVLSPSRRWHRRIAYAVWLPLLGWSASGFYHLLQNSYITSPSEKLTLPNAYLAENLSRLQLPPIRPELLSDKQLNSLALVNSSQGPQYRLSLSPANEPGSNDSGNTDSGVSREARFKGKPQEQQALYIHINSGEASGIQDPQLAREMALNFSGFAAEQVSAISQVTHFGPSYDFRNKRLPVWQVEFNDSHGSRLFVDTRSGVLVDSNRNLDRAERWSFSILHKWTHLSRFMSRLQRDLLIIGCLLLSLLTGILGVAMQVKRRQMQKIRKNTVSCCAADA